MKKGLPLNMMPHWLFVQFWPPACTDCKFGHHNATTCSSCKFGHNLHWFQSRPHYSIFWFPKCLSIRFVLHFNVHCTKNNRVCLKGWYKFTLNMLIALISYIWPPNGTKLVQNLAIRWRLVRFPDPPGTFKSVGEVKNREPILPFDV